MSPDAFTPSLAAELIAADYAGASTAVEARLDQGDVQACIITSAGLRILVIRGSNEPGDWFRYNLNWLPVQGVLGQAAAGAGYLSLIGKILWPRTDDGATRTWDRGWLTYARAVYDWAKPLKPDCIVGHSLGAAASQIVGYSLELPTIAIAAPSPLYCGVPAPADHWVACYCRTDDIVCRLIPSWWRFSKVGAVTWLTSPNASADGLDRHGISRYAPLLAGLPSPFAQVPQEDENVRS